jgi:hypothetical protein
MQEHAYIMWLLPWALSLTWAVLGLVLVGYYNIGACTSSGITVRMIIF